MAFQKVDATNVALFGSNWIGFDNFVSLFTTSVGSNFGNVIRNTAVMSLLSITVGFMFPILLAILVSEVKLRFFKRTVQTATYMPYFVSAVVVCAIMKELVGNYGAITEICRWFGYSGGNLLAQSDPPTFWLIYLFIDIWQNAGYSSIVFVAAIAAIDRSLYEAAAIDGASRIKRILHITIPSILPTIVMMFTVKMGTMITAGFDKVILLYNTGILDTADTIYSYTYRLTTGTQGAKADFGLAAASGLFQSLISVTLLMGSNYLSKAVAKSSLF
ncbi:MAG: ABC transporter permease subunit [Bacilli bacterium]|nr:ABC transporter permease subunit [Bacilli bacterium]